MWAFSVIELGLSDAEFWALTPAKFSALVYYHEQKIESEYVPGAMICATIANVHRRKGSKPYKPEDFMPKISSQETKPGQSPIDMLNYFKHVVMPRHNAIERARENKKAK